MIVFEYIIEFLRDMGAVFIGADRHLLEQHLVLG